MFTYKRYKNFIKYWQSNLFIKYSIYVYIFFETYSISFYIQQKHKFILGILLGVFDGHGGGTCAQIISKRLFHYISACLLPTKLLKQYLNSLNSNNKLELLQIFNDKVEFVSEIRNLYEASFLNFVKDLVEMECTKEFQMETALENAFLRLDNDLSNEALLNLGKSSTATTLAVAMSGAVAAVAHIDGPHLHVTGVGDCQAVLGILSGMICNCLVSCNYIKKKKKCTFLLLPKLFLLPLSLLLI